ncbi:MAG TPA: TIM barrel protein [Bryobacteraceae bacterium]|jgi:sugar phosphate isomerase/epimerase
MSITRREFAKIAAATAAAALPLAAQPRRSVAKPNSRFAGVQIGIISYSLREMAAPEILPAITKLGINEVELMSNHAEALAGAPAAPPRAAAGAAANPAQDKYRQDTAAWRSSLETMNKYHDLRKQFDDAGINLGILCYNMNGAITDEEIDYAFRMAQALGVRSMSSSSTVTIAKRVAPFADKYKMIWAGHGHDDVNDPEQFAKPETFEKIMSFSPFIAVNLDIGHFTAAGYDAVNFIRRYHDKITNLHLKDRTRNLTGARGGNLRWGDGETPIREVLQLLRREQYPFPANIEYEYQGTDPVIEVAKCLQYAKDALLGIA